MAESRIARNGLSGVMAFQFTLEFPNQHEGGIGPQPHPNSIRVFSKAPIGGGQREVARAGNDQKVRCPSHA